MLSPLTGNTTKVASGLGAAVLIVMLWPVPAQASGVLCLMTDPETGRCELEASWEQPSGGPVVIAIAASGGGTIQKCQRPRRTVADAKQGPAVVDCYGEGRGWYSAEYDCYFDLGGGDLFDIEANAGSVVYKGGTEPGDDGALYVVRCFHEHFTIPAGWDGYHLWFLPAPPDGYEGYPDPTADLIVEAFNQLQLHGPEIGTAPPVNGAGLRVPNKVVRRGGR